MPGIKSAKLKNAAFPEPIKNALTAKSSDTKTMIANTPTPMSLAKFINVSTKPTAKRPLANT